MIELRSVDTSYMLTQYCSTVGSYLSGKSKIPTQISTANAISVAACGNLFWDHFAEILSNQAGKGSQAFAWNLSRETVSGTFGNRSSKRQDQISVLLNCSSEENCNYPRYDFKSVRYFQPEIICFAFGIFIRIKETHRLIEC